MTQEYQQPRNWRAPKTMGGGGALTRYSLTGLKIASATGASHLGTG